MMDASFAGQHDTILGVPCFQKDQPEKQLDKEAISSAILTVWSSLWSTQAIRYRVQQLRQLENSSEDESVKFKHLSCLMLPTMALLVMPLLFPKSAGVLFTIDPRQQSNSSQNLSKKLSGSGSSRIKRRKVSGKADQDEEEEVEITIPAPQMLLTANWGLGESVASGRVNPDTLSLSRPTVDEVLETEEIVEDFQLQWRNRVAIEDRAIALKHQMFELDPKQRTGYAPLY
jgi:phosphoenolpyruvate synthase/pyruvate phosphate dikinase